MRGMQIVTRCFHLPRGIRIYIDRSSQGFNDSLTRTNNSGRLEQMEIETNFVARRLRFEIRWK